MQRSLDRHRPGPRSRTGDRWTPRDAAGATAAPGVAAPPLMATGPAPTPPTDPRAPRVPARAVALMAAAVLTGVPAVVLAHRALDLVARAGAWFGVVDWTVPGAVRVEDVVELVAVVLGAGLATWFCLGLTVAAGCAGARSAGRVWVAGERLVSRAAPGIVRRALVVSAGTGVALAGATLPASAGVATPPPDDLGWSVTSGSTPTGTSAGTPTGAPDAGAGPVSAPVAAAPPPGPGTPQPAGSGATVLVVPGDTLWDIARDHLPAAAADADVATAWPAWYAANAAVIGSDPDLIRPGQRLTAPAGDHTVGMDR